ncbi:MAG: RidA family protein [Actinobacteria bacterium]|nr:RidA family protein [Actinomycetota bacterium]
MPGKREIVEVEGIAPPFGSYSHGAIGSGRVLHVAGQVGAGPDGEPAGEDAESQARQAFANLGAVLAAAGTGFDSVLKLTAYVTDRAHAAALAQARAEVVSGSFPASTVVVVAALLDPRWLLEVEAVAVVPE